MEKSKDSKKMAENGENKVSSLLDDINLDDLLSEDYAGVMEGLEKESAEDNPEPKRRGRPPKNGNSQATKAGKPVSKSVGVRRAATVSKKTTETKKPSSLANLILFAVIFAALVGAQFIMKMDDKKGENVNISAVEITAEEKLTDEDVSLPEVAEEISEDEVDTEAVATVEESEEAEVIEPVNESEVVKVTEKVVVQEKAKEKVTEVAKPIARNGNYYRRDSYTNGSSLDLDGYAARQRYRQDNYVKVRTRAHRPETYERSYSDTRYKAVERAPSRGYEEYRTKEYSKSSGRNLEAICAPYYNGTPRYQKRRTVYRDSYSDRRNPWNGGGVSDLDHPANQSGQMTARRQYRY
jgi:hypothetical protein